MPHAVFCLAFFLWDSVLLNLCQANLQIQICPCELIVTQNKRLQQCTCCSCFIVAVVVLVVIGGGGGGGGGGVGGGCGCGCGCGGLVRGLVLVLVPDLSLIAVVILVLLDMSFFPSHDLSPADSFLCRELAQLVLAHQQPQAWKANGDTKTVEDFWGALFPKFVQSSTLQWTFYITGPWSWGKT